MATLKAGQIWTNGGREFKLAAKQGNVWPLLDPATGEPCGFLPDYAFDTDNLALAGSPAADKLTAAYARHLEMQGEIAAKGVAHLDPKRDEKLAARIAANDVLRP